MAKGGDGQLQRLLLRPSGDAKTLAEHCESLRAALERQWFGESANAAWSPRCDVVVHPTRDGYLKAVGAGGGQTAGASYIQVCQERSPFAESTSTAGRRAVKPLPCPTS